MKLKLPDGFAQATLPIMPEPECKGGGNHIWVTIPSYTVKRWWPEAAYLPFCAMCGVPKPR